MKAFVEIEKFVIEDIITTSIVTGDGLINGGSGDSTGNSGNSGGWGDAQTASLLD